MRIVTNTVLLIVLAMVVAAKNPKTEQYAAWAKQEISGSQADHPFLNLVTSFAVEPLIKSTTRREDFILFSVFTTSLDESHETRTLGVVGFFIPLPATPASQTAWRSGAPSQTFPHVIAGVAPNTWKPEDGYVWITQPPKGDLRVRWQPGQASYNFDHVVATNQEGKWLPADGYAWDQSPPPPGALKVHWRPGQHSTLHEHVVTAPLEQRWIPEQGFTWIENPPKPGDFRVRPSALNDALDDPPRLHGKTLRRCGDRDHFMPESPCWFASDSGMYVASKLGNMRSSTFAHWPIVDDELSGLDAPRTLSSIATFSREQLGVMLKKCSEDADARGLSVELGLAHARWVFRRECMSRMGVEPATR